MQTLLIEVDGRVLRIAEERVFRIGRSIDADIVLAAMSVSRTHAELRPTPDGWVLVDAGSSGGTFVGGQPVTELAVTGRTEVQCGPAGPGSTLVLTPQAQASPELTGSHSAVPAPPPPAPTGGPGSPYAPPAPDTAGPGSMPPPGAPSPGSMPPPGAPSPGSMPPPGGPAPQDPAGPPPGTMPPPGAMPPPGGGYPEDPSEMTVAPGSAPIGAEQHPRTGPDLLIVAEGEEYRFRHPASISIGRRPECDIVISDQSVSRHHGQITATQEGWVYQNASEDGTYVDGRRVDQTAFDETTKIRLGHPVAGEEVTLVPILSAEEELRRFAAKRRSKRLKIGGIIAAAAVVAIAAITIPIVVGGSGTSGGSMATLEASEAAEAKAASVWILTPDASGSGQIVSTGSGSIVSDDGKILTNAHVADPGAVPEIAAEGGETPEFVLVSLTDPENGYRADEDQVYRAELIASDGERDAAVVQIYADAEGNEVNPVDLDLPVMEIGNSGKVSQGDDITVFGFPGISSSEDADEMSDMFRQVSQTGGSVATIVSDDGDPRGVFDVTARIAPGNSGGGAVDNDARLIGVPTRVLVDQNTSVGSGRVVPVAFLSDTLEEAGLEVPSGN